jgi:hypothetical protein
VLRIFHFSDDGASEADVADFVNLVTPLLRDDLTRDEITTLLGILASFDERFDPPNQRFGKPPSFCASQPLCREAVRRSLRSLGTETRKRCGVPSNTLAFLRGLFQIKIDADLLGDTTNMTQTCLETVVERLLFAIEGAVGTPLAPVFRQDDFGLEIDLDGDGAISIWEFGFAVLPEFQRFGVGAADATLQSRLQSELDRLRRERLADCASDPSRAAADLRRGFAYAKAIAFQESEYLAALRACGVDFVVTPATAQMEPGSGALFQAQFTDPNLAAELRAVTWSASAGSIDALGNYSAPGVEGTFTITATLSANPAKRATAQAVVKRVACSDD